MYKSILMAIFGVFAVLCVAQVKEKFQKLSIGKKFNCEIIPFSKDDHRWYTEHWLRYLRHHHF